MTTTRHPRRPRHYHVLCEGRDAIALDAAAVDAAVDDVTGRDRTLPVLTTVCYDAACLDGIDPDTLPAGTIRTLSSATWCRSCWAYAELDHAGAAVLHHAPGCPDDVDAPPA